MLSKINLLLLVLLAFRPPACAKGIHGGEAIVIGGIKQWIEIRAEHDTDPVILFLHGGPGNSAMSYAGQFTSELQKHFVIILWDQRETGKTAALNTSPETLTVDRMEKDVIDLINYLRSRFSQDKIWLMGHSWGGFLALSVAAHFPAGLRGCLAVSPMVYQVESERLSLKWLRKKESANPEAIKELNEVAIPFQNGDQLFIHRAWLARASKTRLPGKAYVKQWAEKWLAVFNAASQVNFFLEAPAIDCPIYFFVGRKDYQTNFKLTEEYFKVLKADKKQLFWFDDSGHNLILTEPKKFQAIVIRELSAKRGTL